MIDSRDNTQDSITNHSYLKLAPLSSLSIRDPLVSATITHMDVDADLSIQWICEAQEGYQAINPTSLVPYPIQTQ